MLAACGASPEPDPRETTAIRIAHLTDYAWRDRNQTGQPVDFKPGAECEALYRSLEHPEADTLVIRGVGSRAAFERLYARLENPGGTATYLPGPTPFEGIGFISPSRPIRETRSLSDQSYEVKGVRHTPLAGAIRSGGFWIWNAVWPEPEADYECRRNEARLLAQALRPMIRNGEEVLLTLHSRSETGSPMFRMLEETGLERVVAADDRGDSWTHRDPRGILYRQDQWIFATPGLASRLEGRILDTPDIRAAGDFRHQLLVCHQDRQVR